jgi:hypothetical protein
MPVRARITANRYLGDWSSAVHQPDRRLATVGYTQFSLIGSFNSLGHLVESTVSLDPYAVTGNGVNVMDITWIVKIGITTVSGALHSNIVTD